MDAATAVAGVVLNCWAAAAYRYDLPVDLLFAIGQVESAHKVGAIGVNTNGSRDLGLMQINDRWLPLLATYGIREDDLLSKPCTNVQVGAWILAQEVQRSGYTWQSIGAYNAGPLRTTASVDDRNRKLAKYRAYANRVLSRWHALELTRRKRAESGTVAEVANAAR